MHGNGERDPLDGWLSQQIRPLPPPPGTFELITRRARRRKIRKLAVTVASAAAVAAAVALTVPGGLLLRVSPSQVNGQSVAVGKTSPSIGGTQRVTGSGTPLPKPATPKPTTPSPSGTASGPIVGPAGPVPDNFQPASVTFVSTTRAWAIGQAGTPGHCADANPYICTSIVSTSDGGKTWQGGPAPKTGTPSGATGVGGIRFLDGVNGWAYGPELWATHDSGTTWTKVPTNGYRVIALETAGSQAYALFAKCATHAPYAGYSAGCTSFTLMTTAKNGDAWTAVGHATSNLTNGGKPTSAMIALTSTTGYLLAPDGTLYSGPLGSPWQQAGKANCLPGPTEGNAAPAGALLALQDSTDPVIACNDLNGTQIYRSSTSGATWTEGPSLGILGTPVSFTAAPNGTLVLATTARTEVLPAGASQWEQAQGTPRGGFSYVGMTTDTQGVAVPVNGTLHEIYMTTDSGTSWAPATPITPGN